MPVVTWPSRRRLILSYLIAATVAAVLPGLMCGFLVHATRNSDFILAAGAYIVLLLPVTHIATAAAAVPILWILHGYGRHPTLNATVSVGAITGAALGVIGGWLLGGHGLQPNVIVVSGFGCIGGVVGSYVFWSVGFHSSSHTAMKTLL